MQATITLPKPTSLPPICTVTRSVPEFRADAWPGMLPGVAPTGKHVRVPLVVIVHFRDGKLAHEHIYWDQASVLAQLGLIDAANLPLAGVESAGQVLNPSLSANRLMERTDG